MKTDIKVILILYVAIAIILGFVIKRAADIPVVYWSYSQDKCVTVFIDGEECDCAEMPEKYERVWVR